MDMIQSTAVYQDDNNISNSAPLENMLSPPVVVEFNLSLDVKPKSREQAKEILLNYVKSQEYLFTSKAVTCEITSIDALSTYHIKLETFVEFRTVCRAHRPDKNEDFGALGQGQSPGPWDMVLPSYQFFEDNVEKHEIPFTSVIDTCCSCQGHGQIQCPNCKGSGNNACARCGGNGQITIVDDEESRLESCSGCGGSGMGICSGCSGSCQRPCGYCNGSLTVRFFMEMTRTLRTLTSERVINSIPINDLPERFFKYDLKAASGHEIFQASKVNISPPKGFNDEVDKAFTDVYMETQTQIRQLSAVQHQQRVQLDAVPVTCVKANANGDNFKWYIYGTEDRIELVDWPPTQCCGMNCL
jgi:hypothetical protein